ncbi:hexosaminidase (glycosyl hydrolase family 20, catalytic domain) containing [Nesidiocoris tenuis]|uniref:beta-N-acetylhexosaminidase n=1 Tax=Nesidiocoris tenuis TaxID=355587 RepID=A0ABN7AZS7_9HEMI|nr:hexosaminidase (glycosyl hydrolase family 20, catalytic domain) containing [Nesidiocoris tenuis]
MASGSCCKPIKGRRVLQFCIGATFVVLFALFYNRARLTGPGLNQERADVDNDYALLDTTYVRAENVYFNREVPSVSKEDDGLKEAMGTHRIVHLDLKGAAPKVSYFGQLFPFLKKLGATGLLIEYEDTFPYRSADISATHAYSKSDIEEILRMANDSQLMVIPLIQTLGHLEFVLKLDSYKHLREAKRYPQAICPSKNETTKLLHKIIDEIVEAHKDIEYLHIGCDEVYQLAVCSDCRTRLQSESWGPQELFLDHVKKTAKYIKQKYPSITVLIWDDELRHIPRDVLSIWKLGELVEPVVWKYSADIEGDLNDVVWSKYHKFFPHLWFATAFKGAKSPDAMTNTISIYLDNHKSWVKLITKYARIIKFRGAVLTGWQRYDHFAVLCELLPVSIPSLAVNLLYLGAEYKNDLVDVTSEAQTLCRCDSNPVLTLNNYLVHCVFPGSRLFLAITRYARVLEQIDEAKRGSPFKGWMTAYNRNRTFSAPSHVEEATNEIVNLYSDVTSLERDIEEAMDPIYFADTFVEWSATYIKPVKDELRVIVQARDRLLAVESWPKRSLD